MYSSTLSLTSALDVGGWSTPRPGRFTHGNETRYPLYRRLGWRQGRSGRLRKISPPTGNRSQDLPSRRESLSRTPFMKEPLHKIHSRSMLCIEQLVNQTVVHRCKMQQVCYITCSARLLCKSGQRLSWRCPLSSTSFRPVFHLTVSSTRLLAVWTTICCCKNVHVFVNCFPV
jgi:hypothetical protein